MPFCAKEAVFNTESQGRPVEVHLSTMTHGITQAHVSIMTRFDNQLDTVVLICMN